MSPVLALRPAILAGLGLVLSSCGMVESDSHRFERFGERVAAIEVPLDANKVATTVQALPNAATQGLRPALAEARPTPGPRTPLTVQVMDPHDLWDARDAGLRGAIVQAAPALAQAVVREAGPRLAETAVQHVSTQGRAAVRQTVVQLGAFSSRAAAMTAWREAKGRLGGAQFAGLTPRFEAVTVGGRALTRLKVGPVPLETAAAVCRAAAAADPWCRRATA